VKSERWKVEGEKKAEVEAKVKEEDEEEKILISKS